MVKKKINNHVLQNKIESIDSARRMMSSLSNLIDNFPEGINKIKCKDRYCFLEYKSVNGNLIKYECYLVQ